jgi:hypothetical protein
VRDGDRLLDLVLQRRGLLSEVGLRGQHVAAAAAVRRVLCHAPIEEEAAAPEQTGRRHIARHAARLPVLCGRGRMRVTVGVATWVLQAWLQA